MFVFVIKNIREKKNISIYKLNQATNISRSYLEELENNKKNPTLEKLYLIAKELNVNIKDLFFTTSDIKKLREEMHNRIDEFGLNSPEVYEISQILDSLINLKNKEE